MKTENGRLGLALWRVPPSKADIPVGQYYHENTGEKNKNQHQHPIEGMINKAFGAGFHVAKSFDHVGQALFAVRAGQELIDRGDEGLSSRTIVARTNLRSLAVASLFSKMMLD